MVRAAVGAAEVARAWLELRPVDMRPGKEVSLLLAARVRPSRRGREALADAGRPASRWLAWQARGTVDA